MNYLGRIDSLLQKTSSAAERGVLFARKAAYLARAGKQQQASELVAFLRSDAGIYEVHQVPIFLSIVDGLIAFFTGLEDEAYEKWRRAKALASACGYDDAVALSSAWLAHYAFGRFDFRSVRDELKSALDASSADQADCLARISLVVAECAHLAGDRARANRWYSRSRYQAEKVENDATVGSIMFNTAAMQIVNYRKTHLASDDGGLAPELAVLEAQSAESFELLAGVRALPDLTPVLKAQAFSLAGQPAEAAVIYGQLLAGEPISSQVRSRSWLVADWGYCVLLCGDVRRALELSEEAESLLTTDIQIDDLASTYSRLAQIYASLGNRDASHSFRALASKCWGQFSELQLEVLDVVGDIEAIDHRWA